MTTKTTPSNTSSAAKASPPSARFYVEEFDEELTEEQLCEGLNPHDIGMIAMMNIGERYALEASGLYVTVERIA